MTLNINVYQNLYSIAAVQIPKLIKFKKKKYIGKFDT